MLNTTPGKNRRSRQLLAANTPMLPSTPPVVPSAALARVITIADDGTVLIAVGEQAPVAALVAHQVAADQLRRALTMQTPVLVVALEGDPRRPVIIGIMSPTINQAQRTTTATVDGRRVELTGQEEVVLTCGKASITLTKAGKVLIKGTYVSSSASQGINRITGGSIQIN